MLPWFGIRIKYPETNTIISLPRNMETREHTIPVLRRESTARAERDEFHIIPIRPPRRGIRTESSCFHCRPRFFELFERGRTQNLLIELYPFRVHLAFAHDLESRGRISNWPLGRVGLMDSDEFLRGGVEFFL